MSDTTPPDPPPAENPAPPAAPAEKPAPAPRSPHPFRPRKERPPRRDDKPPVILEDLSSRGPNLRELDAQIQKELDAAFDELKETDMLSAAPSASGMSPPSAPGRKKGKVIAVHGEDVFVEIPGGRGQGLLSIDQFDRVAPAIGTEVEVDIEGYDGANGLLLLTRLGAVQHVDWSSVAVGQVVEARVTETNKGGLAVEVNGIRGFMPFSQLDLYRVEQPEQFVNQRLRCVVTEVDPEERNLVVSRRHLLEKDRDEQKEKFWATLDVGQVRKGIVRSIREFGAFVDLGGADGLIPVSELSWERVNQPQDIVKEGQTVEVKVIRLDRDTRKIGLSLKQMQVSPWETLEQRVSVGSTIKGKVTRLAEFGAFVEVEPGIEGLVHISELAPFRVRKASAVVQVGQEVDAKVLSIDKENRRMSLSVKAASAKAEVEPEPEEAGAATPVKPRPRNIHLRGGVGQDWRLPEE
ncbi:MAG: 30S ribosomal protein S1 [Gemmataceae bacterium]